MKLLDRYIGSTVMVHMAAVMLVLLVIYLFTTVVAEMGYVGKGDYQWFHAILYSMMLLPRQAYELFPLIALLGTMLGLGALANRSELTVMRAAGVSVGRISASVMRVGIPAVVLIAVVGEFVAPVLEKEAIAYRLKAITKNVAVQSSGNIWVKKGDTFINVRKLLSNDTAKNIFFYRFDDNNELLESAFARSASYRDGVWHLVDVAKSTFREGHVYAEHLPMEMWDSDITPGVMNIAMISPENMAISELFGYVSYLRENQLESQRYEFSFWLRIFMPFAAGGMILLAIPFVFGSLRSVTVGHRIMVGALLGITFYIGNAVIGRMGSVYDFPPLLSAAVPIVLVYALWMVMLRRVF